MADPDLTRRLRDLVEANAEMNPGMVNGDILAAADRIDQLEQQLADLHTQRREHDKVVAWADDALARRDARIADLLAERDEARAALADLHTAIGDPDELRRAAVSVGRDRKVTSAEAERRILTLARIAAAVEGIDQEHER